MQTARNAVYWRTPKARRLRGPPRGRGITTRADLLHVHGPGKRTRWTAHVPGRVCPAVPNSSTFSCDIAYSEPGGCECFRLGAEELPPRRHPVAVAGHEPDRLAHLDPFWAIRRDDSCEHGVAEVANLLRPAVQAAEREHDLFPPPSDPVVSLEGLAFCLRDQGRELHVGVNGHEEPVDVATVYRREPLLSASTFSQAPPRSPATSPTPTARRLRGLPPHGDTTGNGGSGRRPASPRSRRSVVQKPHRSYDPRQRRCRQRARDPQCRPSR